MTLYPFFSSSKGNCTLLVHQNRGLLIDCGISCKQLEQSLKAAGLSLCDLDGLLLTHEHSDHIKALPQLQKRCDLPIYGSGGTLLAAEVAGTDHHKEPFKVGAFHVTPIETSHDAADPCGYRIEADGKALAVVTDTGRITPAMQQHLAGCSLIMLESNYDPQMLEFGPYNATLKRRVRSEKGHLSNEDCAAMLSLLAMQGDLHTVVLAHISDNNNTPLTAKMATLDAFSQFGIDGIQLEAGGPFCPPLEI